MKITIAQINPVIGDLDGNLERIQEIFVENSASTDLIVFPELAVTGYPPRDLLENPDFIEKVQNKLSILIQKSKEHKDTGILIGVPFKTGKTRGTGLYNSAVLISNGQIIGEVHKTILPVYDVFDEIRYFDPSSEIKVIEFKNQKLGISICEDMWNVPGLWEEALYDVDPIAILAKEGASVLINLSASPFYVGKDKLRYDIIKEHASKHGIPLVFANQVGGNDELVFDGRSMCVDKKGNLICEFPAFSEHVETFDANSESSRKQYVPENEIESVYKALLLGVRDYIRKCGFSRCVVGLSGGIDSAVTCALAEAAIGKENVTSIYMPSDYSAKESGEYSEKLAGNLGIEFKTVSISEIYESYRQTLKKDLIQFDDKEVGVSLQNIQARIRGNILMAYSNKYGHILLTTGNKSELAVGYCTLYGDMAGGLAVISDVPKKMVYELAEYINRENEIIPDKIITRAPSAELKPNQTDQDTLPPYDILDQILYYYLEERLSEKQLLGKGFDISTIKWVIDNTNKNEYKRKQAPPGLKVTSKAFGMGRRMPIAAKYSNSTV